MRVVETDNFDGDYPDASFLTAPGMTKSTAESVAERQNKLYGGPYADRYWKVVDDDYELQPGFEP